MNLSFACSLRMGEILGLSWKNVHIEDEDIAAMLNIGRTSAYNLVKEGHFKTVRIGNAIRTVSYTHLGSLRRLPG